MTKDEIFNSILGKEGGYVDHPADRGGPTNWGITQKTARAHGFTGDMRDLTREKALAILNDDYWYGPRFDQVAAVSSKLALELCDTGVNMGPKVPSKHLQRWLTALNRQGKLYPDLEADGIIGPRTISAIKSLFQIRGYAASEAKLLKALNCTQGQRYLEIAEADKSQEEFLWGWLDRVEI